MVPIYFPYTCIAERVAEALSNCFGSFVVYQPVHDSLSEPMQAWKDRGIMEVRVPVTENESELKQAVKNFRIWADLHGDDLGGKTVSLKARMASMSLLSAFSSSHIVAEIKDSMSATPNSQTSDPLLAARIFLYFAQEFDRQNHELTEDLLKYDREQAELIRRLKIEDDPVAEEFADSSLQLTETFDDYLIADRLESWSRIFFEDPDPSGLLVTHSPAMVESLLEGATNPVQVIKTQYVSPISGENGQLAVWQENLHSCLNWLLTHQPDSSDEAPLMPPATTDGSSNLSLTVYQAPGQSPRDIFTRWTANHASVPGQPTSENGMTHTLIALVQM